ncbi:hypothetical protein JFU58_23750 [Pseudomonas sp. TH34]|uniref:hypothetical protein n=1 Tax=Pseudomonas TaxID=286 RepID=UPI0011E4D6E8|nr:MULTISPECIES: hypothetical protein [Pseudomonas]MBK5411535.1 hypothetical protein [Pseudomonas sp. TH34]WVN19159.1 hypothetical protein VYI69_06830 [Pseudomonas yamanorum]
MNTQHGASRLKAFRFLALLSLPLFSGCSTLDSLKSFTTAYQEPQNPTTSRLRVITDQVVRLIPDTRCVNWDLPGAGAVNSRSSAPLNDQTHNDKRLGIAGGEGVKNSAEVYVQPDTPLTVVYSGTTRRYQCFYGVSFVPEAGADYEATSEMCTVAIYKVVKNGATGEVSHEQVKSDRAKVCPSVSPL